VAISRDQLRTWAQRGDPLQAWHTYVTVKGSLRGDRLNGLPCDIYPQGSYANKTNIVGDSDVDMVVALQSAFYADKHELTLAELEEYGKYFGRARVTWLEFRNTVISALGSDFFIKEGSKCVKVRSGVIRLPADVLISLDFRYYRRFPSLAGQRFDDGVQFYESGNRAIVNYPQRHIDGCTRKDNNTGGTYKKIVRIIKNARNALVSDDSAQVDASTAPSYFVESLLWNVPDSCYSVDFEQAYRRTVDWLYAKRGQLSGMDCPNRLVKIFSGTPDAPWKESQARLLIDALNYQLNGA
jgi:hypothetical protein